MEKILDNPELLASKQKNVRATGLILFIGAVGLALARIFNYLLVKFNAFSGMDEVTESIVGDLIFTLITQAIFLFLSTFLVYKLYMKGKTKDFLKVSNVRPVSVGVCLIAVVVGLLAPVFSSLINLIVNVVFLMIGVNIPTSATVLPENFNFWVLLINVVLTAVFPGICEEIFNRGIVLGGIRSMLPEWATVLMGGLIFGLFHQYVFQTFYTGAFGMVIVFITLKTRSSLPAMIIHFTNNFIAVLTEFASFYGWKFMSFQTMISELDPMLIIPALILGVGAFALSVFLLLKCHKADVNKKLIEKLVAEGKIPQEEAKSKINVAGVSVIGGPLGDVVYYKPTARDLVFYWGAFTVAILSTVFTLFWYML